MSKYGIENVRGGSYSSIELDDNSLSILQKEIWHSKNSCIKCGRNSHFAKDCYVKTDVNGNNIYEDDNSLISYESSKEAYSVWCCDYCNKEYDTKYGCIKHEENYCKKRPCEICGKKGHREVNCND